MDRWRGGESRDDGGVGRKPHGAQESVLHSNKLRNQSLSADMQVAGSTLETGSASGDAIILEALLDSICTSSSRLSESKVVVR